jgi:hypothetical protein
MYDQAKDLIDALRATPDNLDGVLRGVTQERAQALRGGDEGWSVVEVVCHLRDGEERTIERVRAMRDQVDPLLAGYDQEQWARERNYAQADLREAQAAFIRLRSELIGDLVALDAPAWKRAGQHEEQGTITIANLAIHIVAHDAIHCAQLARQLRG